MGFPKHEKRVSLITGSEDFQGYEIEIVKKKIRHIYFRVYPSQKKIVISAPGQIAPDILNKAILSKYDWLKKQVKNCVGKPQALPKKYLTGDNIWYYGRRYSLQVSHETIRRKGCYVDHPCITLVIPPGGSCADREKAICLWYRKQLKQSIQEMISKWQPIMGVTVTDYGVRKMKTRWGSCNITAQRIWLNLALVKLAPCYLEYVVVHEMVHLLERKHNDRFKRFMDGFIPDWRSLKKELDRSSVEAD